MAGDWIKMTSDVSDKPEIHQMAGILSIDPDAVVGKLFRVWAWFDKNTIDGHAYGVTFTVIDRMTFCQGFGEAMMLVGWLEQDGHEMIIPKFERHNGETAKKRALGNKRKEKERSESDKSHEYVTEMSRSERDKSVTREEKRREEKENTFVASVLDDLKQPTCPHEKVIALYAEALPMLPYPRVWEGQRQELLRARWRWVLTNKKPSGEPYAIDSDSALDFFRRFFGYVAKCPHLVGENDRGWTADLAWLVKAENFAKVLEGKYEAKGVTA